ncbi:MAG TPA: O-antigen polymerase [Blastocatellia bacterium]|nr:O-antigen polymerase [Blastocatellia bacterium]
MVFDNLSSIDIPGALLVDLTTVTLAIVLLLRYGRLSHSHPGTIYLFFHLYTFTFRLFGLLFGAETLFSEFQGFFEIVTHAEIVRAALLGDLSLAVMTVAWIKASGDDLKKAKHSPTAPVEGVATLSLRYIWIVVAIAFPLGVFGLLTFVNVPGLSAIQNAAEPGEWQSSNYFFILQVWAGLALLALIYWYGFRWWLLLPMGLYLLIMAYQGYHRFRVIIPILLLVQIFLDRRRLRWPPLYLSAVLVALILIYFPLKGIGNMVQEGESVSEIVMTSTATVNQALAAKAPDQYFLDEFACGLSLMDDAGHFYYGSTYLALVTLPVPRQWWPDKPGLADYLQDISKPWRPMGEMGMIVTFLGESYANFGYAGVVVIPFLLAYVLGRIYFHAYRSNYFTVARLSYLLIACNLIQVYRDGLISVVVFTWVNMMPLMVIVLLHYVLPSGRKKKTPPAYATPDLHDSALPEAKGH